MNAEKINKVKVNLFLKDPVKLKDFSDGLFLFNSDLFIRISYQVGNIIHHKVLHLDTMDEVPFDKNTLIIPVYL